MALTLEQVRAALEPEEPDYPGSARKLGPEALPHLETLITGDHTGIAAKAAYLAGLIGTDESLPALQKAARSAQPQVRIAAAAAAGNLSASSNESLLMQLVDDADAGVQKVALRSAPVAMSDELKMRVDAVRGSMAGPAEASKKSPSKKAVKKATGRKKGK